jgi:Cu(I)/Ag(I) efflux system membrane fusion protein
MKNNIKTYSIAGLILIIGIFIGASLFSSASQNEEHNHGQLQESTDTSAFTCSMHPQIRKEEPGDCPICGMELIPASSMEDNIDPDAIKMSKTARQLAGVETLVVGNQSAATSLNLSGRLKANQDETQSVSANFKARIEKLYVNEDGEKVTKGQVIAELYAPDIQVLKEELALAKQQQNDKLLNSIKQKIQNYELSVSDIETLKDGRLTLKAPRTGYITELTIEQGDNLKTDQNLMRIADLSTLWAIVDLYESDLEKINVGDELNIETSNQQKVSGKITFISPVLDDKSRSAKARVVIDNSALKLKPGVFIKAKLSVEKKSANQPKTLMIPKSAVLWTGKRSVVYQLLENENGVYFKMKEVEIGSSSSDFIEIVSGLQPGDKIVSQGAFSIDAEAQLSNKPSMMNPDENVSTTGHKHDDRMMNNKAEIENATEVNAKAKMKKLIDEYKQLKNALVSDDFEASKTYYKQVNALFFNISSQEFQKVEKLNSIDELREEFIELSEEMIAMIEKSNPTEETIYIQRCPMADSGEGARWLSFSDQIKNPYYGASMLKCGSVVDSIQ